MTTKQTLDTNGCFEYLRRYGYVDDDGLDRPLNEAIKRYQAFHGLDQTGELDEPTKHLMEKPRCGVPDILRFSTFTTAWDHRIITYAIQNNPANFTMQQVIEAISAAFEIWAAHIPLVFDEVPNNQDHDIDFRFVADDHGDGFQFDGPDGVLAHAFAPPPNGNWAGDVHFDNAETFSIDLPVPDNSYDLIQIAAHEIGHALGLSHSSVTSALMWSYYHTPTKRDLDSDDIAGIQSLYGTGFLLQTKTALHETGTSWDFGLASNRDLFAIQRQGKTFTEIHVLNASQGYQSFALQTPTVLHKTDENWSFLIAPNRDVFAINQRGASSTEVHVLSAAQDYQQFSLHVSTGLHLTDENYVFLLAPNRDLFVIKRMGVASTEIHVLSAGSNYSEFSLQTSTGLHRTDMTFDFAIAPNRDVAAISKQACGRTEVHILAAESGYREFNLHLRTVLQQTDNSFDFAITPERDLFVIKKSATGTSSTEIHIVDLL